MERMDAAEPTINELEDVRVRIEAFIVPLCARTVDEKDALDKAVRAQWAFEDEKHKALEVVSLPEGMTSFTIGHFAGSFAGAGYQDERRITKQTISPTAYAYLLKAGLLYRGVRLA